MSGSHTENTCQISLLKNPEQKRVSIFLQEQILGGPKQRFHIFFYKIDIPGIQAGVVHTTTMVAGGSQHCGFSNSVLIFVPPPQIDKRGLGVTMRGWAWMEEKEESRQEEVPSRSVLLIFPTMLEKKALSLG